MNVTQIERKIMMLELRTKEYPNLVMNVLGKMADSELDLMEEYVRTRDAGFNEEQIQEFMGEKWKPFQKAAAHFEDEYQELVKHGRELLKPSKVRRIKI